MTVHLAYDMAQLYQILPQIKLNNYKAGHSVSVVDGLCPAVKFVLLS